MEWAVSEHRPHLRCSGLFRSLLDLSAILHGFLLFRPFVECRGDREMIDGRRLVTMEDFRKATTGVSPSRYNLLFTNRSPSCEHNGIPWLIFTYIGISQQQQKSSNKSSKTTSWKFIGSSPHAKVNSHRFRLLKDQQNGFVHARLYYQIISTSISSWS